jgi:hypothetical protein
MIEISDQLRNAKHRLIQDLRGVTAPTVPTLDPSAGYGYFEYVEGGNVANTVGGDIGGLYSPTTSTGILNAGLTNTGSLQYVATVSGDLDDILMFTSFALDDQYVGKAGVGVTMTTATSARAARSRLAEIAWHSRNVSGQQFNNIHRRVFLINGGATLGGNYSVADQSMREVGGPYEFTANYTGTTAAAGVTISTLNDLTMRERRSLHQPYVWPYEMLYSSGSTIMSVVPWSWTLSTNTGPVTRSSFWSTTTTPVFGLPTLIEQSVGTFPGPVPSAFTAPSRVVIALAGTSGNREAEDVILTDVVGFDVKAWDPGAPVFRAPLANAETLTTNVTDTTLVGLIVPGDPGYGGDGKTHYGIKFPMGALHNFISNPLSATNQPVAFGAYVDLNYMWLNRCTATDNVISTTSVMNRYFKALGQFESQVLRKNETPVMVRLPRPSFAMGSRGRILSGYCNETNSTQQFPAVWDTWSRHYEYDAIDNDGDGYIDEGTDGIDNPTAPYPFAPPTEWLPNGFVDEPPVAVDLDGDGSIDANEIYAAEQMAERDAPPPYDAPLRGIKVTIRVMEQDSRQVREVSTVHEFIPF